MSAFTFISFLAFTGLVAFISWRATRSDDHETSTGYFLAGRSLSWVVIAGSLLLTNLSTEQLVGLNGGGLQHGMQVMAWEVWSSIAIVLMALVFLPRYLRGGVATVSEFLARRYDRSVGTLVSVLLLLSLLTNLLPFVLYSGALFMLEVFGVADLFGGNETTALWATVIALGVIGSIYAIFGGLKAVAVSDTLNGVGLLIGGLMIPILGIVAIGDQMGDGGFMAGVRYITEHQSERLSPIGAEDENIPFSTLFTGMLFITTYYWCTNQAIVQRTFGSRSLAEGQKGVLFAAVMKLLGPLYLVLPGIIAFHLFSVHRDGGEEHVIHQVPDKPAVMVRDETGIRSVFEQDSDGKILNATVASLEEGSTHSADGKKYTVEQKVPANSMVSRDANGNAMVVGEDALGKYLPLSKADKGYGRLALEIVPSWLLGFFAAVIFGAILSSFNSGLNSAATLFSVDIYKSLINKDASEAQMVRTGKILGIIIAIGAIAVAPMIAHASGGLFDLMKQLAAFYNIPLLAIVVVGIFSKRVPSSAAFAAVLVGVVFYGYFGMYMDNTILGTKLHWLHIAGMNFVLIVVTMLLTGVLKPRETEYIQAYTEDVDVTPWKFATPVGVTVLILIGAMYYSMSLFG